MSPKDCYPEFLQKKKRPKRIGINIAIMLIAFTAHIFLQTALGSFIAGRAVSNLPYTTLFSLGVLVFVFSSTLIGLFLQASSSAQNRHGKILVSFLSSILISVSFILTSRLPYSSVYLFWGVVLQIIIWFPIITVYERANKPIIGIPKNSLADFDGLIDAQCVRPIRPDMDDISGLDRVVLKESDLNSEQWSSFLINCMSLSIEVEEHMNSIERLSGRVNLGQFSFRKSQQLINNNSYLPIKRVADVILSIFLLVVLLPILISIALLISIENPGNPIFKQRRVGLSGQPFTIYKFRTMRNTKTFEAAKFAEQGDTRITVVGKILRKTRIDELPQLWNVIIGEMSLIGPRPEQLELINSIQNEIPAFSLRHSLRPGITGWAQINQGYADNISKTREKLSYDLWYVTNVSVFVDISIAIRTLLVMLTGRGSR